MENDFITIAYNDELWRYKTIVDKVFGVSHYYAEVYSNDRQEWVDNQNLILPDDSKPEGYRKNLRLIAFEAMLKLYFESKKKTAFESTIKKGKQASISGTKLFPFNLLNEYKAILIRQNVTLAAYINTAIREKLIRDGLLTDRNEE